MSEPIASTSANLSPHGGSDELNLIDFPISVLRHQQPRTGDDRTPDELVCTIESYDAELDRVIPRKLTRRTSSKHGFPTPLDEEVLIGLLTLTKQQNNFQSPRVTFRTRDLYELMGWHNNGRAKQRLSKALDRLQGLNLKYENSWTSGDNKFEKEFSTGLLDSYELVTRTSPESDSTTESYVQWASEVFADMQRGNVKQLDTECFFGLKLSVTKRLYRFLDKHLASHGRLEINLITLAEHVGISGTRHIGKIKERLADGIRELEELGDFIKSCKPHERYTKKRAGHWLIHFERPLAETNRPRNVLNPQRDKQVPSKPTTEATQLVSEFYSLWSGDRHHVATRHETYQGEQIIRRFGPEKARSLLPVVVKMMRKGFQNAHAFGATINFWPLADEQLQKSKRQLTRLEQDDQEQLQEQKRVEAQKAKLDSQRQRWTSLPEPRREAIRQTILNSTSSSETLKKFIRQGRFEDPLVELACLAELSRQE